VELLVHCRATAAEGEGGEGGGRWRDRAGGSTLESGARATHLFGWIEGEEIEFSRSGPGDDGDGGLGRGDFVAGQLTLAGFPFGDDFQLIVGEQLQGE
jgi:hypothetical protein